MADVRLSEWLKVAIMHPLQERVVGLGVCPKCHKKNLRPAYEAEGMQFNQCGNCLNVYVTDSTNAASKTVSDR